MNNQQHGDYQVHTENGDYSQKEVAGSHAGEVKKDIAGYESASLSFEDEIHNPGMLQTGQGSMAYELLLLQQRLDSYEQLHIEEMAELREKIEKLRRAFLQETNPHMRILAPSHDQQRVIEE